jgi:hypothetical protein
MGNRENTSAVTVLSPKNSIKNEIQTNFCCSLSEKVMAICNKLLEFKVLTVQQNIRRVEKFINVCS